MITTTEETTLTPATAKAPRVSTQLISLDAIARNPAQPRRVFDEVKLQELADSLRAVGQLQPIVVLRQIVQIADPDRPENSCEFLLVMGERRWRAARLNAANFAGAPREIEARVYEGVDEALAFEMALRENRDREDLNPIEEAQALRDAKERFGFTQKRLESVAGRSRSRLANILRLLDLPERVQQFIAAGQLLSGHGEALLRWAAWPDVCLAIAERAVITKATQAQLEKPLPFADELSAAGVIAYVEEDALYEVGLEYDDAGVFQLLKALPFIYVIKGPTAHADDELIALDPAKWAQWLRGRAEMKAERDRERVRELNAEIAGTAAAAADPVAPVVGIEGDFRPGVKESVFRGALAQASIEQCRRLLAVRSEADLSAKRRQWVEARLAKLEKAAQKAAAAAARPVDLSRLEYGSYKVIDDLPAEVRSKIPPEKIAIGIRYGDPVKFTRDVKLVDSLQRQASAKKNKAAREQLDAALHLATANVREIRDVRPSELATIGTWVGVSEQQMREAFSALGFELSAKRPDLIKLDPADIVRAVLLGKLRDLWHDARRNALPVPRELAAYAPNYKAHAQAKRQEAEQAKGAQEAARTGLDKLAPTLVESIRRQLRSNPRESAAYVAKMFAVDAKAVNAIRRQVLAELAKDPKPKGKAAAKPKRADKDAAGFVNELTPAMREQILAWDVAKDGPLSECAKRFCVAPERVANLRMNASRKKGAKGKAKKK